MFVRGGVYKVVHEALGGTLSKFSVSALMFDYVLTGPISAVSAGLYLGGLTNESANSGTGRHRLGDVLMICACQPPLVRGGILPFAAPTPGVLVDAEIQPRGGGDHTHRD